MTWFHRQKSTAPGPRSGVLLIAAVSTLSAVVAFASTPATAASDGDGPRSPAAERALTDAAERLDKHGQADKQKFGGLELEFVSAKHSLAALDQLTSRIADDQKAKGADLVDLRSWGPGIGFNKVEVTPSKYTNAAASALLAKYGADNIVVTEDTSPPPRRAVPAKRTRPPGTAATTSTEAATTDIARPASLP
jgi:hypothetical protein